MHRTKKTLIVTFFICFSCTLILRSLAADHHQTHIQVHQGYTEFKWTSDHDNTNLIKYRVFYQVMGTRFHSIIDVPSGGLGVNITTADYPGSMYFVRLYANYNGSKDNAIIANKMFRSGCDHHYNTVLGQTFSIQSPGYPAGYHSGVLCRWSITGDKNTWFKISLLDISLPTTGNCSSYLEAIGQNKYCGNTKSNFTEVLTQSVITLQFFGKNSGKGFNISVTGIPILTPPLNVTAAGIGQNIRVNWTHPSYSVNNMTFVIKYRVPLSGNTTYIEIPSDTVNYDIDASLHKGQTYIIRMYTKTPYWQSTETNGVIVQSDCHHIVQLQGHQQYILTSPGYPVSPLPESRCHWAFTTDDNFFFKFTFQELDFTDISDSTCKETYLEISNIGRMCNLQETKDFILQNKTANVTLKTGSHVSGRGLKLVVKSVAKPTDPPSNVRISVNNSHIKLHWDPPTERIIEITNYVILYDIVPDITNQIVKINDTSAIISTQTNRGRMFIIRIAAETEGGRSRFTKLQYVRAECGLTRFIDHGQIMAIFSPSVRDLYQPGVVCKWNVGTFNDLQLRITIDKLDIEYSPLCSKDYLQISSGNKLCGNWENKDVLVKSNATEILFLTDYVNQMSGFILTGTAVAPPPGQPTAFKVSTSYNALILSWKPPLVGNKYVTGYILSYRLMLSANFTYVHITKHLQHFAINTASTQGLLYEMYLQANGEAEPGPWTDKIVARANCGYELYNFTDPVYVSSPNYPYPSGSNTECKWHLKTEVDLYLMVLDLKLDVLNVTRNITVTVGDVLNVTGIGDINSNTSTSHPTGLKGRNVWIHYTTVTASRNGGFLLQIGSNKFFNNDQYPRDVVATPQADDNTSNSAISLLPGATYSTGIATTILTADRYTVPSHSQNDRYDTAVTNLITGDASTASLLIHSGTYSTDGVTAVQKEFKSITFPLFSNGIYFTDTISASFVDTGVQTLAVPLFESDIYSSDIVTRDLTTDTSVILQLFPNGTPSTDIVTTLIAADKSLFRSTFHSESPHISSSEQGDVLPSTTESDAETFTLAPAVGMDLTYHRILETNSISDSESESGLDAELEHTVNDMSAYRPADKTFVRDSFSAASVETPIATTQTETFIVPSYASQNKYYLRTEQLNEERIVDTSMHESDMLTSTVQTLYPSANIPIKQHFSETKWMPSVNFNEGYSSSPIYSTKHSAVLTSDVSIWRTLINTRSISYDGNPVTRSYHDQYRQYSKSNIVNIENINNSGRQYNRNSNMGHTENTNNSGNGIYVRVDLRLVLYLSFLSIKLT